MGKLIDIETKVAADDAKKPTYDNSSLWLRSGDLAIVHFLSGPYNQDDPYFEYYTAHEYKADIKAFPRYELCPVESGWDVNAACKGCNMGIKTKNRFTVGVWVHYMFHATQPMKNNTPDPACPAINYQNRVMYQRTVMAPRYFDQTRWSGSCFDDIILNWRTLGNLRVQMFQLSATGDGLDKKIKVTAIPNSPALPEEYYQKALSDLKPVKTRVIEMSAGVPVATAPANLPVANFSTAAPVATAPVAPDAPFALPGLGGPVAPAPGGVTADGEIAFTPAIPVAEIAPPAPPPAPPAPPETPEAPAVAAVVAAATTDAPARPARSLFG